MILLGVQQRMRDVRSRRGPCHTLGQEGKEEGEREREGCPTN